MMDQFLYLHKTFEKVLYFDQKVNNREFDGCIFRHCDFSNSDFSANTFLDCEFIECNMGLMKLAGSGLKNVVFKSCKLLGVEFHLCEDFLFQVEFRDCILDYASFANKKMPKTHFLNCSMKEATFIGADLTKAHFENTNLENAIFNDTQLKEADFTTAYHFKIDPETNPMKKAKFSVAGIPGLLDKYDLKIE